jgi:hypothetical protein
MGKETKCNVKFETFWNVKSCRLLKAKVKQTCTNPEVSRRFRLPDFKTIDTRKFVNPTHRPLAITHYRPGQALRVPGV